MKSCDEFLYRLYDEDSRRALTGTGPTPADVAAHLASCGACDSVWNESRADARGLAGALAEDAPAASRAAALAALVQAYPADRPLLDWRSALVWGISGAALAGCAVVFAGPLLSLAWQTVLVAAAGSLGAAVELTRQGLEA